MTIPNAGPEHPDLNDPTALDAARRGNHALVHDDRPDDVHAASTRASAVSHRFGGVRYALSREATEPRPAPASADEPTEGGESDPRQ